MDAAPPVPPPPRPRLLLLRGGRAPRPRPPMAAASPAAALDGQTLYEVLARALPDTPGALLVCRAWRDACLHDPRVRGEMLRRPRSCPGAWVRSVEAFAAEPVEAVLDGAATLKAASRLVGGNGDVLSVLCSLLCEAAACDALRCMAYLLPLCEPELERGLPSYRVRMLYHTACTACTPGLEALRLLWPRPMRRRLDGGSRGAALDMLEMAAFAQAVGEAPLEPARLGGVEWLLGAAAAECGDPAVCWFELWHKVPEVAAALLRRPGAAARHACADVCAGVCAEAQVLEAERAFGAAEVRAALGGEGVAPAVARRAVLAFDAPLLARAAALLAEGGDRHGRLRRDDADEVAAQLDARGMADARLLRAAYGALAGAGARRRRALLRRALQARDAEALDVALQLAGFAPPAEPLTAEQLRGEGRGADAALLLHALAEQARERESWDAFGWLVHYGQSRGMLRMSPSLAAPASSPASPSPPASDAGSD